MIDPTDYTPPELEVMIDELTAKAARLDAVIKECNDRETIAMSWLADPYKGSDNHLIAHANVVTVTLIRKIAKGENE